MAGPAQIHRSRLEKLVARLSGWPTYLLVPATAAFNLAVAGIFVYALGTLLHGQGHEVAPQFGTFDRSKLPLLTRLLTYVVISPFLETLFIQHLVAKLVGKRWRLQSTVLLSMLLFGLIHWQSLVYMGYAFLHGFAYIVLYLVLQRKQAWSPLLLVTLAHALFNLAVF
jgi:hypothetical protein